MTLLALRSLLDNLLHETVREWQLAIEAPEAGGGTAPTSAWQRASSETLPLKKVKNIRQVCYTCAIALRLAKMSGLCPIQIAKNITEIWNDVSRINEKPAQTLPNLQSQLTPAGLAELLRLYITVDVLEQGYLRLTVRDAAIAPWLQWLIDVPATPAMMPADLTGAPTQTSTATNVFSSTSDPPFAGFHAYARCCSLLRLAHQEGILQLCRLPGGALNAESGPARDTTHVCIRQPYDHQSGPLADPWRIDRPCPLPWLTPEATLWLQGEAEQTLLHQLVQTIDAIASPPDLKSTSVATKSIQELSDAFATFYARGPIWGNARQQIERTQARLGLISVTGRVLQTLFCQGWGLIPPPEL